MVSVLVDTESNFETVMISPSPDSENSVRFPSVSSFTHTTSGEGCPAAAHIRETESGASTSTEAGFSTMIGVTTQERIAHGYNTCRGFFTSMMLTVDSDVDKG